MTCHRRIALVHEISRLMNGASRVIDPRRVACIHMIVAGSRPTIDHCFRCTIEEVPGFAMNDSALLHLVRLAVVAIEAGLVIVVVLETPSRTAGTTLFAAALENVLVSGKDQEGVIRIRAEIILNPIGDQLERVLETKVTILLIVPSLRQPQAIQTSTSSAASRRMKSPPQNHN